jgi:hypothetical protein
VLYAAIRRHGRNPRNIMIRQALAQCRAWSRRWMGLDFDRRAVAF